MGMVKEPADIEFGVIKRSLSEEEKKKISGFIRASKKSGHKFTYKKHTVKKTSQNNFLIDLNFLFMFYVKSN